MVKRIIDGNRENVGGEFYAYEESGAVFINAWDQHPARAQLVSLYADTKQAYNILEQMTDADLKKIYKKG